MKLFFERICFVHMCELQIVSDWVFICVISVLSFSLSIF